MTETPAPRGAILQRDGQTYAIVPRTPLGLITPDMLENIARVVRAFAIPVVKITSGQRLALVGVRPEDVEPVWAELGADVGPALGLCVHFVQACPGTDFCKFGVQDSLGLGLELEKLFVGQELPGKLKMSVSGCPLCCGEGLVRDVGVIGKKNGWSVAFGGHPGARPRIADVVAEGLDAAQATELVARLLEFYRANAKKRERAARMVERLGIDAVKAGVGLA